MDEHVPPEHLIAETRDLLTHYYDHAYLARHPVLRRLKPALGENTAAAVRSLRRLILEAVERLRPGADVPRSDPAWRPYEVIQQRYILCKELGELESELNLGTRQIQREGRRALEAIATALLERLTAEPDDGFALAGGDALWQEISLAAHEPEIFDMGEILEAAVRAVAALAEGRGVALVLQQFAHDSPGDRARIEGSPLLFKQLIVGALSLAIRQENVEKILVTDERRRRNAVCRLDVLGELPWPPAMRLPDTLLALAQAQSAEIMHSSAERWWHLELRFPIASAPPTVVIVEDNADMLALFARYLARQGYHLVGVSDSTRALSRVLEVQPDAVVLDVMMRDLDGWELLQRIRSEPRLAGVPVVICSVLDEAELAASLGAAAYLRKPIRPAQLLACLAEIC